jgi:hypothetical protein
MITPLSHSIGPANPPEGSVIFALVQHTTDRKAAARWNELRARNDWPDQESHNSDHMERLRLESVLVPDLIAQLQSGDLIATGIWGGVRSRELISKDWFAGEWRSQRQGKGYLDIATGSAENFSSKVHELLIFRSTDPKVREIVKRTPSRSRRDVGGAPRQYDEQKAAQEIVRLAYDGGLKNKRQLKQHMVKWAAQEYADPPDDKTVQRWIAAYCPPGVPPR